MRRRRRLWLLIGGAGSVLFIIGAIASFIPTKPEFRFLDGRRPEKFTSGFLARSVYAFQVSDSQTWLNSARAELRRKDYFECSSDTKKAGLSSIFNSKSETKQIVLTTEKRSDGTGQILVVIAEGPVLSPWNRFKVWWHHLLP